MPAHPQVLVLLNARFYLFAVSVCVCVFLGIPLQGVRQELVGLLGDDELDNCGYIEVQTGNERERERD